MKASHATTLNTLTRVQRFLDLNGPSLGDINASGYRKILDDVVDRLSGHAADQTTTKRTAAAEAAKERVLRNALKLNHLRPIATVANAQLRQVPEFAALKMPPKNATSRTLITWAAAMRAAAIDYTDAFVGAGLPADFIDQLASAADTLSNSLTSRTSNGAAQRGATIGLDAEATRGRQAVKVLDSLVEPLIQGNLALLAQWTAAKRFGGKASAPTNTSIDAAAKGPTTSSLAAAVADGPATPLHSVAAQVVTATSATEAVASQAP
ncbi:MAG TPA: hypothetical protein VGH04_07980 [Gemmatimonadaceae bacterium]|jgi:hypothetical protein